jgi:uncharacterized protein
MSGRIILAGGSGFLGQALAETLNKQGHEVIVLGRATAHQSMAARHVQWDGRTIDEWAELLEGARAIVNLTGRSVNCRHTPENRRAIMNSRVDSVRVLGQAVTRCAQPPKVFIQASSLAIYGNPDDRWCDEDAAYGEGFSEDVCKRWESALEEVRAPGMRKVVLRIGIALAAEQGALPVLARLTRWYLGGTVGHGRQYVSWIHIADLNSIFVEAIKRDDLAGIFNATGPNPATNAEFMGQLRSALHRPCSPPVPAWATRIGARLIGTEASLALTGRRCRPKRLLDSGFHFKFPDLRRALADLFSR